MRKFLTVLDFYPANERILMLLMEELGAQAFQYTADEDDDLSYGMADPVMDSSAGGYGPGKQMESSAFRA